LSAGVGNQYDIHKEQKGQQVSYQEDGTNTTFGMLGSSGVIIFRVSGQGS